MSRLAPGTNYRDWLAFWKHRRNWALSHYINPSVPNGARVLEDGTTLRITQAGDTRVIE